MKVRGKTVSLFEWLGESANPGPVGSVDVGGQDRSKRSRAVVIVCFLFAVAALAGWVYLVLAVFEVRSVGGLVGIGVATLLYLVLGYFVHPKADTSNLGWLGGTMDHPFRYSDDLNRALLGIMIVLLPGRFVSEGVVDMVRLIVKARK